MKRIRKTAAVLLTVLMIISACPFGLFGLTASAAIGGGMTGECRWSINGTVLTISGNGIMENFDYYNNIPPWRNEFKITRVIINNGVKSIGEYAFYGCTGLTSITIPSSIMSIGKYAFNGCTEIANITIQGTVTNIGEYAFYNTQYYNNKNNWEQNSLYIGNHLIATKSVGNSYNIKDGTKTIAGSAFYSRSMLTSITIPNSVTSIGDCSFQGCTGLVSIIIPKSVTYIGKSAFRGCTGLTSITIPDGVTSIGRSAFSGTGYYNKTNNWEQNVLYIGNHLIEAKSAISGKYEIKSETKTIAKYAFSGCIGLTSITIPDSVTNIEDSAFENCEKLSSIKIADYSISEIKPYTFRKCTALTEITLPNGLKKIRKDAFYGCSNLARVTIPDSVTEINSAAFSGCPNVVIYGSAGSYAESFARNNGIEFIDNKVEALGFALAGGAENINLEVGKTYRAKFEFYPEDATDTVTMKAENANVTISGMNIYGQAAGDCLITAVSSGGLTCEFNVHTRQLEKIAVKKQPDKLRYKIGEGFDKSGFTVAAIYTDGSAETVTDWSFSDFTVAKNGKYSVTVKRISGNGTEYTTVIETEIVLGGFELAGGAKSVNLDVGETYHAVFGFFPDFVNETVTMKASNDNVEISGTDIYARTTGSCVITATSSSGLTYEFKANTRCPSKITVKQQPDKLRYNVGESFDKTGTVIEAVYSDGFTKTVNDWTISGFDSSKEGECDVTVKWTAADGTEFTASVKAEIIDPLHYVLAGIRVSRLPYKLIYAKRTALNTAGAVIIGLYDDGSEKELSGCTFGKINVLKLGKQTITVTYGEFTATFDVTVTETGYADGDVNQDGTVDIRDLIRLKKRLAAEKAAETTTTDDPADVDKNSKLNALDIAALRKILLGLPQA